ncbi:hypothetical protein [Methylocapsa palsarum]|uniref:Uncharacterized protein n=1 Tax=Methylocapsa palsarum TaxID=1612308 RepID=A0A1I3Z9V9_9HYPH|nr:hypothetical protein [Methylocapsa palsarum]SFK40802.1 hypothetical protein SAMN05444581_107179 [Methylocapsa palsarum]
MKRQPKPFSVEIKRSRRSPGAPAPSQASALELEIDEAAPPQFTQRSAESDLVVPAFLQTPNGSRRLTSKENSDAAAKDRDKVFASLPARQPSDADQSGNRTAPRVLQSLVQPEISDLAIEAKPMRRVSAKKGKSDKPIARKTPATYEPNASVINIANREPTPSRKPASVRVADEASDAKLITIQTAPQLTRPRVFLGRADASTLPPGQRWKRRLHPRAW